MKQKFTVTLFAVAVFCISGCADHVSKGNYPVSINSIPAVADFTITDKKGEIVYIGDTPAGINLTANSGWFSKTSYQVKFEKERINTNTVSIEFKQNGWYFGNTHFGGVVGLLIVDKATGAMYQLEEDFLNENLLITTASAEKEELRVFEINVIPSEWKKHLLSLDRQMNAYLKK
jgi:hypothetical protein